MDFESYRQLPGEHWSTLKEAQESALAYHWTLNNERPDTDALKRGRAVHYLLGEPGRFSAEFAVFTERGNKAKNPLKKRWDQFKKDNADKLILQVDEYDLINEMAEAILKHPLAGPLLAGGLKEHTLQWTDPDTGLPCKCRTDAINGALREVKTAVDISPVRFAAQAARLGYDGQLGMYNDGMTANEIKSSEEPTLIVVRSKRPIDVHVYSVFEDVLSLGQAIYKRCLRVVKEGREREAELMTHVEAGRMTKEQALRLAWPGQCNFKWALVMPAWREADVAGDGGPPKQFTCDGEALNLGD